MTIQKTTEAMCSIQQAAYALTFSVAAAILLQNTTGSSATKQTKCEEVNKNCTARVGCGMALHNFLLGCNTVINGETSNCTAQCTRALISLFSTEDNIGRSLMSCDCQGDSHCTSTNNRVSVCATSVLDAMQALKDSNSVVSCSLARWLCEADAHCQTAFTYYLNHCQALYSGHKCTKNCNDSLAILHKQSKAAKLRNCECEGPECVDLQRNTRRLCFNNVSGYSVINGLHGHSGSTGVHRQTLVHALFVLYFVRHFTITCLLSR